MKYLHQYTTVEALKSIITNRTIRLRPLSTMDDMEEAQSEDCMAIGDYIFVSSWSEVSDEMIPMWYMYGSNMRGVRIGLPENPFMLYTYTPDEQILLGLENVTGNMTTGIPIQDILRKDYCVSPPIMYLWWLDTSQPERTNRSVAKAVRIGGHWCDDCLLGPTGVR